MLSEHAHVYNCNWGFGIYFCHVRTEYPNVRVKNSLFSVLKINTTRLSARRQDEKIRNVKHRPANFVQTQVVPHCIEGTHDSWPQRCLFIATPFYIEQKIRIVAVSEGRLLSDLFCFIDSVFIYFNTSYWIFSQMFYHEKTILFFSTEIDDPI